MDNAKEFRDLLDLACEKTTVTEPLYARAFFQACEKTTKAREAVVEEIKLKSKCKAKQGIKIVVLAAVLLASAIGMNFFPSEIQPYTDVPGTSFLLTIAAIISFVVGCNTVSKGESILEEAVFFEPLNNNPQHCLELKKLTVDHPVIAHYVSLVVKSDEALALGDLKVARALKIGAEKQKAIDQGKIACKELHELATS